MVKNIVSAVVLTATLALATTPIQAEPQSERDLSITLGRPGALVGSWFAATATGIRQLFTFHADGTALRTVQGEVSTNPASPPHTPAVGVWRYLGPGRFGVTIWDMFYDVSTGQPLRYNRLRLEVTLSAGSDEASARATVDVVDLQGVVVSSRTGAANLTRIRFEPLE